MKQKHMMMMIIMIMKNQVKTLMAFALTCTLGLTLTACQSSNPWVEYQPPPPAKQGVAVGGDRGTTTRVFNFFSSERTHTQNKYDENEISVFFQVMKELPGSQGAKSSVNGLREQDLRVTENGHPVSPFALNTDVNTHTRVVDIVFVIDITGTMVPLIESAKEGLKDFIKTSRDRGYHTRMCFVTFGDYTVETCDQFYENDPKDVRSSEKQMNEFMSRLSKIRAGTGPGSDPGWPDLDENPMGALIDASKAKWGQDSQRFAILVTDWGFLWSPGNLGDPRDPRNPSVTVPRHPNTHIPSMKEVTAAIKSSQMKVFAVTRTQHTHNGQNLVWDGYNTPLDGEPGIVQSSGGEYFDFNQFLEDSKKKKNPLNGVLEKILKTVTTTYKITYVVDKVSGLNPTLPVEQRNVQITVPRDPDAKAVKNGTTSSMPRGRPEYQDTWTVSEDPIVPSSLQVFVNGKKLGESEFQANASTVRLHTRPKPGDKLRFSFRYAEVAKNLIIESIPLLFPADPNQLKVFINEIEARTGDYNLTKDLDGNTVLTLNPAQALSGEDRYEAHRKNGLTVRVTK